MDNSLSDIATNAHSPITVKQCKTELKRQGLERLLGAVYQREISINLLLVEKGASHAVLEALRYGDTGSIAEQMIDEIREIVYKTDGGERRFQILERFYGLDGFMPARLSAMAAKHNVSRERIRQIKERALISLRYKKSVIEKTLLSLAMRLMNGRTYARISSKDLRVSEIDGFKLFDHTQLLFMHESQLPLTDEQSRILFDLNWAKRARITGCAGSGKTWLALKTARKLAASGERTLLTCFNRALADYLSEILKSEKNLLVTSFHALCLRLGKQAGITIPGGWNNRTWLERFPDLLRRAVFVDPSLRFDAIVVDDAQDFKDNWWQALEASLTDPESGRFYYFYDDSNTRYIGETKLPTVDYAGHLSINLRSPVLVSPILNASYASTNTMRYARMGASPLEFYRCENDEETQHTLAHVFSDLVDKGSYLASDVAILTPRLPRNSSALKARLKGSSRIVRRQSEVLNHTNLSRSNTFQGLERKAIILVDLDERFAAQTDDDIKYFVYMTFSRFVDKLVILGCASAWSRIDSLAAPTTSTQHLITAPSSVHRAW